METEKPVKSKENEKKIPEENIWTDECENLLAEWSEKASCYRWLHGRCEKSYRIWYYCFSIPVIILSTLTGAANVGMDSFVPTEQKSMASAIVGGVNIFAGIISTLQNFLKVAELMEGHRIAGVSWGKLQRNIAIELALDPSRRVIQTDFLKLSRAEYDRLIEAGPIIDDKIIARFNKKFKNYEVSIPSICNGLDKCKIYKIDNSIKMNQNDFIDGIEDIITKEEQILNNNISEPFNIKVESFKNKQEIIDTISTKPNDKSEDKPEDKSEDKPEDKPENNITIKSIETDITENKTEDNVVEDNLDKETSTDDLNNIEEDKDNKEINEFLDKIE